MPNIENLNYQNGLQGNTVMACDDLFRRSRQTETDPILGGNDNELLSCL